MGAVLPKSRYSLALQASHRGNILNGLEGGSAPVKSGPHSNKEDLRPPSPTHITHTLIFSLIMHTYIYILDAKAPSTNSLIHLLHPTFSLPSFPPCSHDIKIKHLFKQSFIPHHFDMAISSQYMLFLLTQ